MSNVDWNRTAILICTHGRVALLEEALFCAVGQSVPCHVLVLNDCPAQQLEFAHPRCHPFNRPEPFATLGEKRTAFLHLARERGFDRVCWLDDDDLALPSYVEDFHRQWTEHGGGRTVLNSRAHFMTGKPGRGTVRLEAGVPHGNTCFFNPAVGIEAGGYGRLNTGEDHVFLDNVSRARVLVRSGQAGYIQRWTGESFPLSRLDCGGKLDAYQADLERRLARGLEPAGRITLTPRRPAW